MKRLTAVLLLTLGLAACGSSKSVQSAAQSPQAKAQEAKAKAIYAKCKPAHPTALIHDKSQRRTFEDCAVPPAKRSVFVSCFASGLLHVNSKASLENDVVTCLGKVNL